MTKVFTEPDMDVKAEALSTAVGRVLETTASIAGRCTSPPPASFNLTEPVPPGACAILVTEDFLDVPLGTRHFWLDSLYVAIASPGTSESSVLVLQVDGMMWITNCVFQGAGNNSRAVDVTTKDEGLPRMYVQETVVAGFTRILAPGIVVWHNASLTLDTVAFRDITLLRKEPGQVINSTAITAYPGAGILMQDVAIGDTYVHGEPAGPRAVAVGTGAYAFAVPPLNITRWPGGAEFMTDGLYNVGAFPGTFLDDGPILSSIRQEQRALVLEALGTTPSTPSAPTAAPPTAAATPPTAAPPAPTAVEEANGPFAAAGQPAPNPTAQAGGPSDGAAATAEGANEDPVAAAIEASSQESSNSSHGRKIRASLLPGAAFVVLIAHLAW